MPGRHGRRGAARAASCAGTCQGVGSAEPGPGGRAAPVGRGQGSRDDCHPPYAPVQDSRFGRTLDRTAVRTGRMRGALCRMRPGASTALKCRETTAGFWDHGMHCFVTVLAQQPARCARRPGRRAPALRLPTPQIPGTVMVGQILVCKPKRSEAAEGRAPTAGAGQGPVQKEPAALDRARARQAAPRAQGFARTGMACGHISAMKKAPVPAPPAAAAAPVLENSPCALC